MGNFGHGVAILGSGSATPTQILDNQRMSQVVETSDEWIASRTGIQQRHLVQPSESLVSLATQAAAGAIARANIQASDIDLILLATSTPDDLFGSASKVQAAIGATQAVAFDLTAACSGFVFGMVTAAQFIRTGLYQNVLLIGADVLSRWVDWSDRRTCVLFGDGAGAVVMQRSERDRLLGFELRSDGTQNACLTLGYASESKELVDGITVEQGTFAPIDMKGQDVYKFAVRQVPDVVSKALHHAELVVEDVDWLLLHQANQRILDAAAQRLGIPSEKVISNMAHYGNTSAASIPIALDEHVRKGMINPGDIIASAGFGAGLTWGAAIFQWG
ncbi:MAG: beta-ketoacyl-ACP synthase III [Cyanothece sp. SIO2G6]|nr:beta-ketoacyl-ACP synthase III [Cyanothece sp. SIO2G6]